MRDEMDVMTHKPFVDPTRFSRRQVVGASVALSTLTPAALVLAGQESTPASTPNASPAASPQASPTPLPPTPTPLPVPDHALNIVRERATYTAPQSGGDLALYIQSAGLNDANPAMQSQDMTLLTSVFEGLVRVNPETMAAEPGLATSWTWSPDGLTLTFALRDDVLWHDGSRFTAADAAFTTLVYRDDYDSSLTGFFGLVADAKATSDTKLVITFDEPDGTFVFNAACQPMLHAATYQPLWEEFVAGEKTISRKNQSISSWIGTGPWRVTKVEDTSISLARFDDYWAGPALADSLTLIVEDDLSNRIAGWKDGKVDVLPVDSTHFADLWQHEGNLFVGPGSSAMFAAFNFHNPANTVSTMMVDANLRLALNLAVNRDGYADQLFNGFIDEHAVGIMTQPWLRDSGLVAPARSVDDARAVLAEGGWVDIDGDGIVEDGYGNKADLWAIVREDERPELLNILEKIKSDWNEIGVQLTVQHLSPEIFDDRWVTARDYDLIAYSIVNYPAFNEFDLIGSSWDIRSNVQGWNPGGYYNAEVDAAIGSWFAATDTDAMIAAAQSIQVGINSDLFGIWFGFPQDLVLVRKDIQGFNPNMYAYNVGSEGWWRGDGQPIVPVEATPVASPVGSPVASPAIATPEATPQD